MIIRKSLERIINPYKAIMHNRKIYFSVPRISESKDNFNYEKEVTLKLDFDYVQDKTKHTYLDTIKIFINKSVYRRGHVEFIYCALRHMENYGVHKDLDVYKALIDVLPKAKFVPQNSIQSEFMHYPKQQQCAIDVLEQMEDNGVMPDSEVGEMLLNIFGKRGHPLRKYWRMMYWMPKFKNLSPWPVPNPPPNNSFELAQMAVRRISSVDIQSKLTIYQSTDVSEVAEDMWIISGQSPTQRKLISSHNLNEPLYIEGPYRIWLRNKPVNYFVLKSTVKFSITEEDDFDDVSKIDVSIFNFTLGRRSINRANEVSVHEQSDGIVLAVCATSTSSKDSLLSWIRSLEKDGNNVLANIPIIFTLRSSESELSVSECSARIEGE